MTGRQSEARQGRAGTIDRWPETRARVLRLASAPSPLLVVSDFDGTLAPITTDPLGARILPLARSALRRLARVADQRPDRLRLAVLSGRSSTDVATRVRVGGLAYLGNHGLEAATLPRRGRPERLSVETDSAIVGDAEAAARLGEEVALRLRRPGWLYVENKGPAVAFHFRQASDPDEARAAILEALGAVEREAGGLGLARMEGRKVVELQPAGSGGKGAALDRLLARERPGAVLVLGDDRSDAEAFRALARALAAGRVTDGVAVAIHGAVETPAEVVEAADVLVRNPRDAARLLSALAGALEREAKGS